MANCKGCGGEIIWLRGGKCKSHPFNARQNFIMMKDDTGAVVVKKAHVSHFVTCPCADQFTKKPDINSDTTNTTNEDQTAKQAPEE